MIDLDTYNAMAEEAAKFQVENERLRAALGPLLDAHWPFVETADHEDENCKRARAALGSREQER